MPMQHRFAVVGMIIAGMLGATGLRAGEPAPVDFNRDVRPILTSKCFTCHGPDEGKRKAHLRLDTRGGAIADLKGTFAVVPGKPDDSELIYRVTTDDKEDLMPPPKHAPRLKPAEVETLRRWIAQGAPYADHWSYVKPERPKLPNITDVRWAQNPIDRFVWARLEREGLHPSPPASREALIRRVSLDLIGLPPTPEQTDAFVNDKSPDAYEKLVDRLLADPAYGEQWARMWLDLARYADSAGYADDPGRTIWMYRDYVIRAFNANTPFDRFTIDQIAGDMLPNPTQDQLIATAFHRNTQTNNEGGTNDEEFRSVAIIDRVNTTMSTWMGTTIMCAQCHNHKYDPISNKEYFEFYAILNNTEDSDKRDERPTISTMTDEQVKRREAVEAQIAAVEKQIAEEAKHPAKEGDAPKHAGAIPVRYLRVQNIDKDAYLHIAELEAFVGDRNVAREGKATQSSTDYDAPASRAIDGVTDGDFFGKNSVTHTKKENDPWLEVDLGKEVNLTKIALWNRTDGNVGDRLAKFRFVAFDARHEPVWVRLIDKSPKPSVTVDVPEKFEAVSPADNAELAAYLKGDTATESPLQKKLAKLTKERDGIKGVPTPIMRELAGDKRRKTLIQHRGSYLDTGDEVQPGLPAAFPPAKPNADGVIDRLSLARWLVDRDNPLTARVTVNRYWERLFGIGIVSTSEEFGSQGEPPSHPQLLDWLAVEFMESGWDIKRLIRLIVTSQTYRQASRVDETMLERDPQNRLLARGPRFRLPAETIRDQALAVAGLLSRKMYGEPVRPPQPNLGLKAAFGGGVDWQTSTGEDRYRRGVYTTWRRSSPYPSMATFDAPNREVCIVRRDRTNTPLQALVTMNDPVYVEAAQALARRMVDAGKTPAEQARYGFRLCLTRQPSAAELDRIVALYQQMRDRYAKDADAAKKMATIPLGDAPKGADMADLAAWTVVANVLMNLDEMFLKL
ncbi:MAG: DUF1553 domain-containing protein [Phycisphaera sp.]|nr:DUF1553 domain-containing protein [Phycisphaera sp.]